MSVKTDNIRDSLVRQLSSLEGGLADRGEDVVLLSEMQEGIGRMLGNSRDSEGEIRRVLQDRYDSGNLRSETYQLVQSMLDRYVSEEDPTSPLGRDGSDKVDPQIVAEAVIEPVRRAERPNPTVIVPEPARPDPLDGRDQVGTVLRDRFLLQQRVIGGSMGVVYKALDRRLAEAGADSPWVAIKVLSPQLAQSALALRALQQEAAKGRSLFHPNIVRYIDLDRDDDLYFIVMEWLEGRTLADILDSPDSRSIDSERAFNIVRQVGSALDHAHRCGIVHADVKPGNIMILPNGDAKIFDFGVARVRQKQLDYDPKFDPGVLGLLTPAYSSMQVLTGEEPVPADDVFSLACLLYRLIAGYRVFGPRNAAEAADEGLKPQRLEELSNTNWDVLKKALSYSRVTRFESMAEFIDALDLDSAEVVNVDIPLPARFFEEEERRGPGRAIFGFFVLLLLSAVVANQLGWLEELKQRFLVMQDQDQIAAAPLTAAPNDAAPPVEEQPDVIVEGPIEEMIVEADAQPESLAPAAPIDIPAPVGAAAPMVDFSILPPPAAELRIAAVGSKPGSVTVTLRENGPELSVDLIRNSVDFPLTLKVEEVWFSGKRSPWGSRQYTFSNNGFIEFPVGQERARVTLEMALDELREADQTSTLRVRDTDTATSERARINVVLEDDDQRAFESTLPVNTVAFTSSQVSVNEQDPAVQLDILRFNPDATTLIVEVIVQDVTATRGEDYFAAASDTIEFAPGQRSTRLLIPLVQDSEYEYDEAFSVELSLGGATSPSNAIQRVSVLIRDDD